jgi:ribonuclease P protein component
MEELFASGKSMKQYPFRVVYSCRSRSGDDKSPVKIAISVPKKIHRRAVKRNFIRRRIREAYRLNKHILYASVEPNVTLNIIVIYISSNITSYATVEKKIVALLSTLVERIAKDTDICSRDAD